MDPQLAERMQQTTQKTATFIAEHKSRVLEAKELHQQALDTVHLDKLRLEQTLSLLKHQHETLTKSLTQEITESQQSELRLDGLSMRQEQLSQETQALQHQVDELTKQVKQKRDETFLLQRGITQNKEKDLPEVLLYEQLLGLKIVGVKEDLLKFIFTNIHHDDPLKHYSLLLDVSEEQYKVAETSPLLPESQVQDLLSSLNQSRDLPTFLSQIRTLFKSV